MPTTPPNRDLYMEERRQDILRRVQMGGRVSVSALSAEYGVSEVTIRADLQALADNKLLVRTHGGAVAVNDEMQDMALTRRREKQSAQKHHIGAAAANLVEAGDAIFLDSSSTALAIAQHLKQHHRITVITSAIAVAQEFLESANVTVVMPGGIMQRDTASLIGTPGLAYLDAFNIQTGFFGAHGITVHEGLTDISAEVAGVKRPLVTRCRRVIAVLDATKWGRIGLASFAEIGDLDVVVTDAHAPAELVAPVREQGVDIILT